MMKKRLIRISVILLSILVLLGCSFLQSKISTLKHPEAKQNKYIQSYKKNIEELEANVDNRVCLVNNTQVLIGNNIKELNNGYYDIKISIRQDKEALVCINKLVKQVNTDIVDDNYVTEIVTLIDKLFDMKLNDTKKLASNIKDRYILLRQSGIDSIDTLFMNDKISIDNYNINFSANDNMLNIVIDFSEV